MSNSVIDQIKDLEEQRQRLIDEAHDAAISQANQAIDTLKELGMDYQLIAKNGKRNSSKQKRARQKPTPIQTETTAEQPTE